MQSERKSHEILAIVRKAAKNAGFSLADIQEQELYLPTYLKRTATNYELRLDGKSSIQSDAKDDAVYLGENDAFVASSIGLYTCKAKIVDGKPKISNVDLFSYVPVFVFTGAERESLLSVYSGSTSIMTDQVERSGKRSNRILYSVPVTQASATTESSYANMPLFGFDQSFLFMGGVNNRIILNTHGDMSAITPADPVAEGYCNVALYVLKGHVIKNGNSAELFKAWNELVQAAY